MESKDFKLINLRVKIFSDFNFVKDSKLLLDFASQLTKGLSILDGAPTVLPIPSDAPQQIPRLVLASKDDLHILELSLDGFSYNFNNPDRNKTLADIDKILFGNWQKILKKITSLKKISKVKDITIIASCFIPLSNSSINLIKKSFLNKEKSSRSYFSIRLNFTQEVKKSGLWFLKRSDFRSLRNSENISDDKAMVCDATISTNVMRRLHGEVSVFKIRSLQKEFGKFLEELPKTLNNY